MAFIEMTGRSVEEAVSRSLKELNVSAEQVIIEVLDEGKKGFLFGFGSKDAKVRVTVKDDVVPAEKTKEKDLEQAFEEAKEAVIAVGTIAMDKAEQKAEELKDEAAEKVSEIKAAAEAKADELKKAAEVKVNEIKEKVEEIINKKRNIHATPFI